MQVIKVQQHNNTMKSMVKIQTNRQILKKS